MIRFYELPIVIVGGVEEVAGVSFIVNGLIDTTDDPYVRHLIQYTTEAEHAGLILVALAWRDTTQDERDRYNAEVSPWSPDPVIERIKAILHNSPPPIPAPQQWELFALLARLHGISV